MSDDSPTLPFSGEEPEVPSTKEAAATIAYRTSNRAPSVTDAESGDIARIDELIGLLGDAQLSIARQLADKNAELLAIERRHAATLNPKLKEAQELFDELQGLSDRHRVLLIPGSKNKSKNFKRNVGTCSWRDQVRVILSEDAETIIGRLRLLGPSFARPFIRRNVNYDVNLDAMGSAKYRERAAEVPGVEVLLGEDFAAKPNGGYRMTSAKPYWPALKDMPGPLQQDYIAGE